MELKQIVMKIITLISPHVKSFSSSVSVLSRLETRWYVVCCLSCIKIPKLFCFGSPELNMRRLPDEDSIQYRFIEQQIINTMPLMNRRSLTKVKPVSLSTSRPLFVDRNGKKVVNLRSSGDDEISLKRRKTKTTGVMGQFLWISCVRAMKTKNLHGVFGNFQEPQKSANFIHIWGQKLFFLF